MNKTLIALTLASFFFILSTSLSFADRKCGPLLTGECVGCHEKEKYCNDAGKSTKYWKSMLKLMESNGADLSKGEFAILNECLSLPSDEVKKICSQ